MLYRILIEIRRHNARNGSCENGINPANPVLNRRNNCRSIVIHYSNDGLSFTRGNRRIDFDPTDADDGSLRIDNINHTIDTQPDIDITIDIGLFHEMLHWFHYLRHPQRYINSDSEEPTEYRYLLRSYYGDKSELYTWGPIDDEDIRTILGTPNYNEAGQLALISPEAFLQNDPGGGIPVVGRFIPNADRFLNGDDLSENVYRMTKFQPGGVMRYKMRFGHAGDINPVTVAPAIPNRFMLAHLVAINCYNTITGHAIVNWDLISGEATQ